MNLRPLLAILAIWSMATAPALAQPPDKGRPALSKAPAIFWLSTWEQAQAEAKRTERPLLLAFGAPRCEGVPGMW